MCELLKATQDKNFSDIIRIISSGKFNNRDFYLSFRHCIDECYGNSKLLEHFFASSRFNLKNAEEYFDDPLIEKSLHYMDVNLFKLVLKHDDNLARNDAEILTYIIQEDNIESFEMLTLLLSTGQFNNYLKKALKISQDVGAEEIERFLNGVITGTYETKYILLGEGADGCVIYPSFPPEEKSDFDIHLEPKVNLISENDLTSEEPSIYEEKLMKYLNTKDSDVCEKFVSKISKNQYEIINEYSTYLKLPKSKHILDSSLVRLSKINDSQKIIGSILSKMNDFIFSDYQLLLPKYDGETLAQWFEKYFDSDKSYGYTTYKSELSYPKQIISFDEWFHVITEYLKLVNFVKQVKLNCGFNHADLHGNNIVLTNNTVIMIDFSRSYFDELKIGNLLHNQRQRTDGDILKIYFEKLLLLGCYNTEISNYLVLNGIISKSLSHNILNQIKIQQYQLEGLMDKMDNITK